jgi:hypothetical protein
LDRPQRPFFRRGEGRIDEGFTQIDLPAVAEIFGEALQEPIESAAALPLLKAAVAGLVRRVALRQIRPRGAGAQDPQHAVEHGARIGPRPATTIRSTARPKRRFEHRPLGVGEVHAARYDARSPL